MQVPVYKLLPQLIVRLGSVTAFKDDKICIDFLADEKAKNLFAHSKTIKDVDLSKYAAVFYPGGHGPMFDLPSNSEIASAVSKYYEAGGTKFFI